MRAVVLIGFGGLDRLEVREVPEPKPGAGEVKVRSVATSVNPIDWKLREGVVPYDKELPAILGRDAAGEVVEIGAGVTRFRVGANVAGLVRGGYGEYVVANEDAWAAVPPSMTLSDAAAIPLVGLTGAELIEDCIKPASGGSVLVTGALGSVGRAAVYAAKLRGARVWAGVRTSQRDAARSLDVEGVFALDDPRRDGPIFDAIADTVGGSTVYGLFDRVRRGGVIGSVVGETEGAREHGLEARGLWSHPSSARLGALLRAVADGSLVIPIAKRFPLSQIRQAQETAQRGAGGKVLVLM